MASDPESRMYTPTNDELAQDRQLLMQRYYEAHPEEVEKVLQEQMEAMLVPLRKRMDELQGQIVFILHRIDTLHHIKPMPKKKTKGVEL